jgi:acyl-CoA thioester hydrolase
MKKASIEVKVAFCDLDGMRSVYHTNYIKWFDLARTKLFMEAGFAMDRWEAGGVMLPLVVCHCEYRAGLIFNDEIIVRAMIKEAKGKTITLEYEVTKKDTGAVTTTGLTTHVTCDENGKSYVLKEKFPELFENLFRD